MKTDNLQTIRDAVSGAGDSLLVLVVPTTRVRDLFGDSAPAQSSYTADLTVPQYREQFEPDLSDSRIRELCASRVSVAAADEANDRHVRTREKTRRPRSGRRTEAVAAARPRPVRIGGTGRT